MARLLHNTARRVALPIMAMLLVLVCVPRLAQADNSATIIARVRMEQRYTVPVSGLQVTFDYVIEPLEEEAPMPVDDKGEAFSTFSLTRNDDIWLEFPVYVKVDPDATPYVYHYLTKPAKRELEGGLYYVDALSPTLEPGVNEYPLEIHVQPSDVDAAVSVVTPTVHVDGLDGPKVADPGWRISYKSPKPSSSGTHIPANTNTNSSGRKTGQGDDSTTPNDANKDDGTTPSKDGGTDTDKGASGSTSNTTSGVTTTRAATQTTRAPLSQTADPTSMLAALICAMAGSTLILYATLRREGR